MRGTAIILLYFGALNAVLSRYAGTCTQNSADHLSGLWIVLISYGLALLLLWRARPGIVGMVILGVLLPVLVWHAGEGIRFAWGVVVEGQSACSLLVYPEYGMDGRETTFVVLWLIAGLVLPALISWRLWHNRRVGD